MAPVAVLVACLLAAGEPTPSPPDAAPVHHVSADLAPLYFAWWPGHHDDGPSDDLNLNPESSVTSLGLQVTYGHRLSRRFELAGGLEYLRAPAISKPSAHHLRATATPFVVFGNGRRYDFSLGVRLGVSAISVMEDWAPQLTTLAVLRNRIWVHDHVGILVAVTSGVHWGVGPGSGGLNRLTTFEFVALRVGVATRF